MAKFGSLVAGSVAARIGARWTVVMSGSVCIAGGLIFLTQLSKIRALVRPIYVRLGILEEMAVGVQQASNLKVGLER